MGNPIILFDMLLDKSLYQKIDKEIYFFLTTGIYILLSFIVMYKAHQNKR